MSSMAAFDRFWGVGTSLASLCLCLLLMTAAFIGWVRCRKTGNLLQMIGAAGITFLSIFDFICFEIMHLFVTSGEPFSLKYFLFFGLVALRVVALLLFVTGYCIEKFAGRPRILPERAFPVSAPTAP